jgi:hypothetical protein
MKGSAGGEIALKGCMERMGGSVGRDKEDGNEGGIVYINTKDGM